MPLRESELSYLLEKIGANYRGRVQRAFRLEEDKLIERAIQDWEEIIADARRDGKDVSILMSRIQRLHKLWWQKGGPQQKDQEPQFSHGGGSERDREQEATRDWKNKNTATNREELYRELMDSFRVELQNRCIMQGVNLASESHDNLLKIRSLLDKILRERLREIPDWVKRKDLMDEIVNDVLGLGVVEEYLQDPSVNEVMINGTTVYYEKDGQISFSPRRFNNFEEVRKIIDRIVHPINRRVDESSPMVDARLPDGSRVNIVVPPVALDGPVITVRKFSPFPFSEESLIEKQCFSREMVEFFRLIILHRQNIMIAGKTSSGKTTLLNLLGNYIPERDRIITIEEMAELQLPQRHVVRLEARPPNIQGKGEIGIRTLFRNALHMRPDRIIVGECRGAETLDMLQAMNTGHDGSISTAHANSPMDLFTRLEAMVSMSELAVSSTTVSKQIASGLDIVIYCTRFADGQRKVGNVCEVLKSEERDQGISMREIFCYEREGSDRSGKMGGRFVATGYVPTFIEENPDLNADQKVLDLFKT